MGLSRWLRNQWDRTAAVVSAVVGLVAVLTGWIGVSGVSLPSEQIPYLASGAVFGLFCLGIAATLWLSADLRDEWRKLDEIGQTTSAEDEEHRLEPGASLTLPEEGSETPGDESLTEPTRVGARRGGP